MNLCTIAECDRKTRCKGLCSIHYARLRKTGTTGVRRVIHPHCVEDGCLRKVVGRGLCEPHYRAMRRIDASSSACTIEGCSTPVRARGWCELHLSRWKYHGSPEWEPSISWGYAGWHNHIGRSLGPASRRSCIDCSGPADEWSYDHLDLNELVDEARPYSTDPDHYVPRCRSCHRKFDRGRLWELARSEAYPAPSDTDGTLIA
jgi:hypothetical protein